jgi:hypothetical protein
MHTITQDPTKLQEMIKKSGLSMEQITEIASRYSPEVHGKPMFDSIEEIQEAEKKE